MSVWVVAADASRARFFQAEVPGGPLEEISDLVHPASRAREQGLVSDSPGRGRGAAGAPGHSVGHEDDARRAEAERFAREVAQALAKARAKGRFNRVHLLAAPRFLGLLRAHLDAQTRTLVASEEDVDVTALSVGDIRARLPRRL